MAEHTDTAAPYSGAEGPEDEEFFRIIRATLPDVSPDEAADAVLCAIAQRLSGAVAQQLIEDLPESLRHLATPCARHTDATTPDKADFHANVAEHLEGDGADSRRVIGAVFSAVQAHISRRTAQDIASQLPRDLTSTWNAARRRHPGPH